MGSVGKGNVDEEGKLLRDNLQVEYIVKTKEWSVLLVGGLQKKHRAAW